MNESGCWFAAFILMVLACLLLMAGPSLGAVGLVVPQVVFGGGPWMGLVAGGVVIGLIVVAVCQVLTRQDDDAG